MTYAAVYGMKKDVHLKGREYSWLSSIFYFGYLSMEFPALWFLTQIPDRQILWSHAFLLGCMSLRHGRSFEFRGPFCSEVFAGRVRSGHTAVFHRYYLCVVCEK